MDKYVNTDIGIYHVESVCDRRDADGHKLYHAKCRHCGYENDMRLFTIQHAKMCRHQNRSGRFLEFKPYWECSRLRDIFKGMQDRCCNPNNKDYYWYGNKGVRVCQEWLNNPQSFEEWALNNGYANDLTIDRIDSDKDYCPSNCRWISLPENTRRAGKVNWITVGDVTLTGRQWADKLGLGLLTIDRYIRDYGLDLTIKLIVAMLKEPPSTKHRKPRVTWFEAYGIQV